MIMKRLCGLLLLIASRISAQNEPCYVCGEGGKVTNPDSTVPIPANTFIDLEEVTCSQTELAGLYGLIPPYLCLVVMSPVYQNFCGCVDVEVAGAETGISDQPSGSPVDLPSTSVPSDYPSIMPSDYPSTMPSDHPTSIPSVSPSSVPSSLPSSTPSEIPSALPSIAPSSQPSVSPSFAPTETPSSEPTKGTKAPKKTPSPTALPTATPSAQPSLGPTQSAAPTQTKKSNAGKNLRK